MKLLKQCSFVTILIVLLTNCKYDADEQTAQIEFEKAEYDFGELEQNGDGIYSFIFSNPGQTPKIIQNVKTSCGCTVPEWSKKPIKNGKKGERL